METQTITLHDASVLLRGQRIQWQTIHVRILWQAPIPTYWIAEIIGGQYDGELVVLHENLIAKD
jgi:hypothetical protein